MLRKGILDPALIVREGRRNHLNNLVAMPGTRSLNAIIKTLAHAHQLEIPDPNAPFAILISGE